MPNINSSWRWAVNACQRRDVGYSQAYRNQQTVNGITYYDCSSFINYALLAGGFSTPSYAPSRNAFTTGIMANVLLSIGFVEMDQNASDFVYRQGDIGVTHHTYGDYHQHTEMCYAARGNTCEWMGAHSDWYALPEQVSITQGYVSHGFDHVYRYGGVNTGPAYDPGDPDDPNSGYPRPSSTVTAADANAWIYDGGTHRSSVTVNTGDTVDIGANDYYGLNKFNHWEITGNATVADENSNSTRLTVSGNCTIKAVYTIVRKGRDIKTWIIPRVYKNQYRF